MTTQDVLNIAGTVFAIAATILVINRLYTMVKDEARQSAEHAARMQSYAEMAHRTCGGAAGLDMFNTPN